MECTCCVVGQSLSAGYGGVVLAGGWEVGHGDSEAKVCARVPCGSEECVTHGNAVSVVLLGLSNLSGVSIVG